MGIIYGSVRGIVISRICGICGIIIEIVIGRIGEINGIKEAPIIRWENVGRTIDDIGRS